MPFEELDKKINELVEQRSPVYDEQSWQQMEKLLDKHLPQRKNKRHGLFILLFSVLLLGGGATYLLYENYSQKNEKEISVKNNSAENLITKEKSNKDKKQPNNDATIITDQPKAEIVQANPEIQKEKPVSTSTLNNSTSRKTNEVPVRNVTVQQAKPGSDKITTINDKAESEIVKSIQPTAKNTANENSQPTFLNPDTKTESVENASKEIKTSPTKENVATENKTKPVKASSKKKKKFLNNIIFSVSAGPDVSKVGQSGTGEVKLAYGAGLGYRISNRFSIHTGFYAGRKVYTATPEDYNPPTNFWTYYPNLEHVDADCKVFEIPLNIYYDIKNSKKANWFISAGLSSIFMKKEVYNYYYKPINSPQYVYYSRTYENKNKHYFSILNLSGGYGRKLSSTVSIKAEPYAKIALTGIGYGKVKLNSGGVLLSVVIQPFNTENKKNKNN